MRCSHRPRNTHSDNTDDNQNNNKHIAHRLGRLEARRLEDDAERAVADDALGRVVERLLRRAAAADGAQPRVLLRLLLRGLWLHIARCTRALSLPTAPSLLTASALLPLPLPLPLQAFAKYKQKREAKKLSYGKKIRYQSRKVGLATRRPVCTHVVLSGKWNGDSS